MGDLFALMEQEHELTRRSKSVWKSSAGTVPICFTWQGELEGKSIREFKWSNKPSIVVNILSPVVAVATPPADGLAGAQDKPPAAAAPACPAEK
jgi:hypothetical protein